MSGFPSPSPAMLALIKPQLKAALEGWIKSGTPAAAARDALPHLEGLIAPELHQDAAELLAELAWQWQVRIDARRRAAKRGQP